MALIGSFGFALLLAVIPAATLPPPRVDHHQHVFSPEAAALVTGDAASRGISARDVIALLDAAHIQRALILSVAYTWGNPGRTVVDEYDKVKAENDWTSRQASLYPRLLRAFCSFNPLKPYAMAELERCSADTQLRHGLKLHFGNSDVDLDNKENVDKVRKIFVAANSRHMPIVVHMRASISLGRAYGREQALIFIRELLAAAPDVPVQVAHLAGAGGYDAETDAALGVFVEAIARRDPRVANLWFDVTSAVGADITRETAALVAGRLRKLRLSRVVYGSDAHAGGNLAPKENWGAFCRLPLTKNEFRTIANNVATYMRF
jgi:predicted TIM-barrel fold metal-dependent hydrolase